MSSQLPLIAIGFAPVGVMLMLVIVTHVEGSLSHEDLPRRRRSES